MKKALVILAVLALLGCLAACGAPKPEALLAGKWKASVASFEFSAVEFTPGTEDPRKGTVSLALIGSQALGSYEVVPAEGKDAQNQVKITYKLLMLSTTRSYYFAVEGDTLTLREKDSDVTFTFTRDTDAVGTTA